MKRLENGTHPHNLRCNPLGSGAYPHNYPLKINEISMKYQWKGLRVVHIRTIVHGNRLTGMQVWSKIDERIRNQCKSAKIYENQWKTNGNAWKSIKMNDKSMKINERCTPIAFQASFPSFLHLHLLPLCDAHLYDPLNLLSNSVIKQIIIKRNLIFYDRN